ncbi:MAG: hypothetical protein ACJ8EK_19955 [Bradyrhizobium sp.]
MPLVSATSGLPFKMDSSDAHIQLLLCHVDLKTTSHYLHLSGRHLKAAASPLDSLTLAAPSSPKNSNCKK